MATKSGRKRRRQERPLRDMSFGERLIRALRGYLSPGRLALGALAVAGVAAAVLLVQTLGGGAEPGTIVEPVRNQRTQDFPIGAEVGQLAPNFEAEDLDGDRVRLSDFLGQPVIINFWATWCTSCRREVPALQRVFEERQDDGLVVLGVDWGEGSVGAAKDFLDDLGASYASVLDPSSAIGDRYRVRGLPVTLAVDRDGIVREFIAGELDYQSFRRFAELASAGAGGSPAIATLLSRPADIIGQIQSFNSGELMITGAYGESSVTITSETKIVLSDSGVGSPNDLEVGRMVAVLVERAEDGQSFQATEIAVVTDIQPVRDISTPEG